MQDVNIKVLKIMAVGIVVILSIILVVVSLSNRQQPVEEIIYHESINDNERVAHYGENLYCCLPLQIDGKTQNALIKMPINFNDNTSREIVDVFDTASVRKKTLNFFENKLFYKDGDTYMYDIGKGTIDVFCEGELQFMVEPDAFIMLEDGDIYKGIYYPATYMARRFEKLADGDFVKRGEDDKKVYYSSVAGSNTIIISLDKESLRIVTLDDIDTSKRTLENVLVTDDFIYVLISDSEGKHVRKISKELDKNNEIVVEEFLLGQYDIVEFIDFKYTKPLNINQPPENKVLSSNDFYFYGSTIIKHGDQYETSTEYDKKMYKYDEAQNTINEYNGNLNERFVADYSGDIKESVIELYHGDKKLTELETGITDIVNLEIVDINIVEDKEKYYLYYEVEVLSADGNIELIYARTFAEGGESKRINIVEK